jgi:Na+-transporting NADH:ubiquinone oxidoreductase subunit A
MNLIRVKKGYNLKIIGQPSHELLTVKRPDKVAVVPERIPFIKPRIKVGKGDAVKIGSVLFEDKRRPFLKFLSPGGGIVEAIDFGPRRVIQKIVIRLDPDEESVDFESLSERDLDNISRQGLMEKIMEGGLWSLLRGLPSRDIAPEDSEPPAIFVVLDDLEPFQPESSVYLQGKDQLFVFGLKVLCRLSPRVEVFARPESAHRLKTLNGHITGLVTGRYPADDPGVLVYMTRKSSTDNQTWYIRGQDVLLIAHLLKYGKYPTVRTMVVGGSAARKTGHVHVRLGMPLAAFQPFADPDLDIRWITGGVFQGYPAGLDTYVGFYETAVTLIPEGRHREFLSFVRPGFNKPSYSRTFLSWFNSSDQPFDCNVHGGVRACIACGNCAKVCPVDILPQLTFKAILAEAVEEYLSLGLLDCVECGLCSYVCPAKIELSSVLTDARRKYHQEQSQI